MRLHLPECVESKFGRLVGYMALQNSATGKTQLDSWILTTSRHEALQSKHVIGCVVAFTMSVPTNTALWLSLTLQDESQQFGNLDEAAAIARMPRKCLVVWLSSCRARSKALTVI